MSVLKQKRTTSKAEFINTANQIYVETLNFLTRLSARYSRLIAEPVAKLAGEIIDHAEKANSIFPSDNQRIEMRKARETDRRYFCGITDEMMAADRKALCAVDAALLKEQAAELGAAMANGVRVVFGSKDAVEAAKEMFDTVETL